MSAFLSLSLVLSACAGGTEPAPSGPAEEGDFVEGGAMTIGLTGTSIGSLDPALANTLVSVSVLGTLCDGLYSESVDGEVLPALAEALPEYNEDRTSATVTLREGVKFTDGTPMDAEAVKFTVERNKTLEGSQRVGDLFVIESVDVVDPLTLQFNFGGPVSDGAFIDAMDSRGMLPYSPTAVEQLGAGFATAPVCVGGFVLDAQTTDTVRFVRDPDANYYDQDSLHLDSIEYKIVGDPSVRYTNLQSGEFDAIQSISPKDMAAAESNAEIEVYDFPGRGYIFLTVNTDTLSEPLVRRALVQSIDKEAISQNVWAGLFPPACSFMAPQVPLSTPETQECIEYDPEAAKETLAEAGITTPVPISLEFPSSPEFSQMAALIQAMANETGGFDVTLRPTDTATTLANIEAGTNDLAVAQWTGGADPTSNIMLIPGAFQNRRGWEDPRMNELVAQLNSTADPDEQKALYAEVQALINEELPNIYIVHNALVHGARDNVAGLEFNPSQSVFAMRAGFTS